jgi:hypothetical protein
VRKCGGFYVALKGRRMRGRVRILDGLKKKETDSIQHCEEQYDSMQRWGRRKRILCIVGRKVEASKQYNEERFHAMLE